MTELTFDPYATLGLPRGADARQVRSAYRRLARQHHPDLTRDRQATERMQRINRAWQILSSPSRRARYDTDVAARPAPAAGHWSGTRRRAAQWAPPPAAWSAGPGPGAAAGRQPPPWTDYREEADGPGWPAIVAVLAVVLVLGPILFGLFPVPVFALLALFVMRWVTAR